MKKLLYLSFILFAFSAHMPHAYATRIRPGRSSRTMHWLGHDTFRISGEKVIYTDPFKLKNRSITEKADIILITHDHSDPVRPGT